MPQSEPMSGMNTTPLIDVMLVLLIMFIITIPVATHSVEVDLPGDCAPNCQDIDLGDVTNKVIVTQDGEILWNGEAVDEVNLAHLLRLSAALPVEPELHFEPVANAPYEHTMRVLALIDASNVTNFGFVGNERYSTFPRPE